MGGYLHIIMGSMFAGKTTKLIQCAEHFAKNFKKIIIINNSLDIRYDITCEHICSHDNVKYECISLRDLSQIYENRMYKECDIVMIDEAQFFDNLKAHVLKIVEIDNKYVIISGLLVDAQRNTFGELIDLIPFADHIDHMKANCEYCNHVGIFSTKLKSISNSDVVDVGNSDKYISVCRYHYLNKKVV